ncbi:transferase hexapeptide repeat containing protein [Microcoleus sp. D3_18a_C4]|uniref:transferase hexapeptide repeat containing protein n=1 Tax=Microcoleus sp. D3_18a_C4 TaxID=3055332 RepID=UPI002FCE7FFC
MLTKNIFFVKQKQIATPGPTNWLQQITGSFKDEPAFEEVLVYGRSIRQGDESFLEAVSKNKKPENYL